MNLVSIIIPTYNEGGMLLDSVNSARNQTYPNIEVIIVNDGTQDKETIDVLRDLSKDSKIKITNQENGGPSNARNNGIINSKGNYIFPLDADDTIEPEYVEKTVKILDENKDVAFVNTHGNYFGIKNGKYEKQDFSPFHLAWENIVGNSALVRRSVVESVNGYTDPFEGGYEDWDFWLKIIGKGYKWKLLPEYLLNYRVRDNSRSKKNKANFEKFTRELLNNNEEFFKKYYQEIYIAGKQRWYLEFLKNKKANNSEITN